MGNIIKIDNKCCLKYKNQLEFDPGWSYFCRECGRYCYDQEGWSRGVEASIQKAKELLEFTRDKKQKEKYILIFKSIKGKRFKNWFKKWLKRNG